MRIKGDLDGKFPLPDLRNMQILCCVNSLPKDSRMLTLIRVAVLASSILLMLPGTWGHSATPVEYAHLPAGLAAWQRHSLGIYRVCGPTSKLIYALPAYLAGIRIEYPPSFDTDIEDRREWELGRLFQIQHRERYHSIYRWSRLLPILVTVLGGCLICEWSTRLFGTWPGIASLCLWSWMPPILAHGSLLTSDMPSAVALVLAARLFWSFLLNLQLRSALLAGLALGVAVATKFTLLILYPCWAILLIVRAIQLHRSEDADSASSRGSSVRLIIGGLLMTLVCILAIDSLYLFQGIGIRLLEWNQGRSSLARNLHHLSELRVTAWLLHIPLPIPLELLRGLDAQMADTERLQSAYLLGQTRLGGWSYWYAAAAFIKIPLPSVMLFALSLRRIPTLLRGCDPIAYAALCLLVPAAEVAFVISATTGTGTNAAFRYLIPCLASLCVWVGRLVWDAKSAAVRGMVVILLAWLAVDAIVATPDHLSWQVGFGRVIGRDRPDLIGDSLDWSQDLARLGVWISRHTHEGSTVVCVYGLGSGEPYGLVSPGAQPTSDPGSRPAYLAVSADILYGYEVTNCVQIEDGRSSLDPGQREFLAGRRPFERVGKTIRIYRLRDLWSDRLFP